MVEYICPPFLVSVDDDLGVRCGTELVPAFFKYGSQLLVIINFAVQHDRNCTRTVEHRLMSSHQINDGETPETETQRSRDEITFIVWPAMSQRIRHTVNHRRFYRRPSCEIKLPADAAH